MSLAKALANDVLTTMVMYMNVAGKVDQLPNGDMRILYDHVNDGSVLIHSDGTGVIFNSAGQIKLDKTGLEPVLIRNGYQMLPDYFVYGTRAQYEQLYEQFLTDNGYVLDDENKLRFKEFVLRIDRMLKADPTHATVEARKEYLATLLK